MSLVVRTDVTPYNGQVEFSDPNATAYPQWETGEELAVALPQVIAVATQGDLEGPVHVEVWRGELEVEGTQLRAIYEGDLLLTEPQAAVGNTAGNEFHLFSLPSGRHRIKVFTASRADGTPNSVYFLIED